MNNPEKYLIAIGLVKEKTKRDFYTKIEIEEVLESEDYIAFLQNLKESSPSIKSLPNHFVKLREEWGWITYKKSTDIRFTREGLDKLQELFVQNNLPDSYLKKNTKEPLFQERNMIFFGPPGTGKSYKIKSIFQKSAIKIDEQTFRVTFHPEYTYFDFVGSYKPVVGYEKVKEK